MTFFQFPCRIAPNLVDRFMHDQTEKLISQCLSGDAEAFESLYNAHAGRVVGYLLRCGFAHPDAQDLTQETFIRVFKSLGTFDSRRGSFSTWLSMIVRNVARRKWSQRKHGDNYDPELAEEMFAGPGNPHLTAEKREELAAVNRCVSELPDELGKLVEMRYVQGLTTRAIAAQSQLPEATVRMKLDQARGQVARCLRTKGIVE